MLIGMHGRASAASLLDPAVAELDSQVEDTHSANRQPGSPSDWRQAARPAVYTVPLVRLAIQRPPITAHDTTGGMDSLSAVTPYSGGDR